MKGRFLTEKQIAAFAVYLESEEKAKIPVINISVMFGHLLFIRTVQA